MDGFNALTSSRGVTQGGLLNIPYSEIALYCRDQDLIGETKEDFIYLLQAMDNFFVDWQNKYLKKKMDADMKAASKPKPSRR